MHAKNLSAMLMRLRSKNLIPIESNIEEEEKNVKVMQDALRVIEKGRTHGSVIREGMYKCKRL